jgi:exodeoxyribonuclease-3
MRIATWNVNSARARLPRLIAWLEEKRPDVCCLQETKCLDEKFPREPIEDLGYSVVTHGQRTYNGVAILARRQIEDVERGLPDGAEDDGARLLRAIVGDLILLNVYVVNGEAVGSQKYAFKLAWLERLRLYLARQFDMRERVIVLGDFNVTFDDRDVYDPRAWHERILCSTPERRALWGLLETGLQDSFRKFHEEGGHYTWWDFRTRGFERGRGLRIDHVLMSAPALEACTAVEIDVLARAGARPSDHAPVVATLAD